eukprot:169935-Prorocentrum_minimum.AAC.1
MQLFEPRRLMTWHRRPIIRLRHSKRLTRGFPSGTRGWPTRGRTRGRTRGWRAERVDPIWEYHKEIGYGGAEEAYGGGLDTIEEYSERVQLVQYQQYKAMFEGFQQHMWEWCAPKATSRVRGEGIFQ